MANATNNITINKANRFCRRKARMRLHPKPHLTAPTSSIRFLPSNQPRSDAHLRSPSHRVLPTIKPKEVEMCVQSLRRAGRIVLVVYLLTGCERSITGQTPHPTTNKPETTSIQRKPSAPITTESPIVAAARQQIGITTNYDPAYVRLRYPGGDVPADRGVCTDVVIRALRTSLNMDLQRLVHEDMARAFAQYPQNWGLKKPDPNIDHRRVPNLQTYFVRQGYALDVSRRPEDYRPGDVVTCMLGGNLPHIMIVSDQRTSDGIPLVIHNIGSGTMEEPRLFSYQLTGHYRIIADTRRTSESRE
jgi:hypothetical protein